METPLFTTGAVMLFGALFTIGANRWRKKCETHCVPAQDRLPEGVDIEEIKKQWLEIMEEWAERQSRDRPSLICSSEGEAKIVLYFRRDSDCKSVPMELTIEKVIAISHEVIQRIKEGRIEGRSDALQLISTMIFLDCEWRRETSKDWEDRELREQFLQSRGGEWHRVEKDLCRFTREEFELYFGEGLDGSKYKIEKDYYIVHREVVLAAKRIDS